MQVEVIEAARKEISAEQVRKVKEQIGYMADALVPDADQGDLYNEALKAIHALGKIANMLEAGELWDAHAALTSLVYAEGGPA